MKTNGILIDPADHVVTLAEAVKAGETVSYVKSGTVYGQTAMEDIPQYHKMAIKELYKGQTVLKYGARIGEATGEIAPGSWVHRHNLDAGTQV